MVNSSLLILFFIFLFLFISSAHVRRINQIEALNNLQKTKWKTRTFSDFEAINLKVEILSQNGLKEKDKIVKLPGQPPVKFDQYGGYITVNRKAGRALYYYFTEAEKNKESLPLLLWLNGGPGCSSLAYGAMQELGPFRVLSDGKTLYKDHFAWNHAANVLFLESPAGVGFSYSNTTSEYLNRGDKNTAADNYAFLLNWLQRFPEYKNRDFYISGESYAGHYVPQLAHTILHHNKAKKTLIKLKGIIIGNAVTNHETDHRGLYDYLGSHAIIADNTMNDIRAYCNFSPNATTSHPRCSKAISEVDRNIYDMDLYSIYSPVCINGSLTSRPKKVSYEISPCSDDYTHAYLNRPDVQQALHANITKLDHDWEPCSETINMNWADGPSTVIPLLREFIAKGIRVWIFSGDTDGRVPFTSTKYSLDVMKLQVRTPWHPWLLNKQVGGFTEEYEGNLTLATVRGAGHQVPSYQPRRALALITHFLNGTPLPHRASTN